MEVTASVFHETSRISEVYESNRAISIFEDPPDGDGTTGLIRLNNKASTTARNAGEDIPKTEITTTHINDFTTE